MPRRSTEWADAAAMWITAAGWAGAAERRFGSAWVVTPDAVATAEQAQAYGAPREPTGPPTRRRLRHVPEITRTAAKDVLRARAARSYRDVGEAPEWRTSDVRFVWQHHDLFHRAGEPLARRRRCPLVSYVHAPQVWEAAKWGVRRPGWGRLLERVGERPQLLASDVVACVSDEVAAEVVRLGVAEHRVLVSPMAVDATRFSPDVSGDAVREQYGLRDAFVVGWTGSFRRFHGLEMAVDALVELRRAVPGARLLLVGQGFERDTIRRRAVEAGVGDAVVFPGPAAHDEIPGFLAAMDVALVVARAGEDFHYSPLKMREYLACGTPVVAPRIGEIGRSMTDREDARLYQPGDVRGLAGVLTELALDPAARARIGRAGREWVLREGTWDVQLDRLFAFPAFSLALRSPTIPG